MLVSCELTGYRNMARLRTVLFAQLFAAALAACAVAPTQEMADARAALKSAEEAGGREYAGEGLVLAKKALAEAERQLELGGYSGARESANQAREAALVARNIAAAIAGAKAAMDRAAMLQALDPEAVTAFKSAQEAARGGDERRAMAEANLASEYARAGENRAYGVLALKRLDLCAADPRADKELIRQSREALERGQGAAAWDFVNRACLFR